jgi:drug/metabolite transporter (DMT)-like permease
LPTQNNKSEKLLFIGIVFSMLMWGLSWPSGKVLSTYGHAPSLVFIRYLIVALSFAPVFFFIKDSLIIDKKGIPGLLLSGILLFTYAFLFLLGLRKGSAGAGGILVTTMNPIVAYCLSLIITRKLPSRNESIGLIIGIIAGSVLLKIWGVGVDLFDSGNIYFLLAAFTWALLSRITAKAENYGSSFAFSFWLYITTTMTAFAFVDIQDLIHTIQYGDRYFWMNVIFMGTLATTAASTCYFYATTKLGPARASSFIFLVPFSAGLSAWFFLGEVLLPHTLIGGILGIMAVYIINKKK